MEEIDITKESRMLLSAIYRTGQNFGKAHIVDILRGSKNTKVLDNRHDNLSVYGIGSEITKASWGFSERNPNNVPESIGFFLI